MRTDWAKSSDELLVALAGPALGRIDGKRVALVFAHPDDETVGCGAQLSRLAGASVVIVTDGAPRNLQDARRLGFTTAADYAAARLRELVVALDIAGVRIDQIASLGVPDQEAAFRLVQITIMLAELFARRGIGSVMTHAYEGGHPDHDATAFCVHAAAALRRREHHDVRIVEVPLYRLGSHGVVRQAFAGGFCEGELALRLTAGQRDLKRRMIAAHRTQREVLSSFAPDVERFRPAPCHDFARPPNDGQLLYERYPWGLDGQQWNGLVRATGVQLGLGDSPC